MHVSVRELGARIFGAPPGRGAPKLDLLLWIRRFYLRPLPLYLAVIVLAALLTSSTSGRVILAVTVLLWLAGLTSLSARIRRSRRES
jgi:hypothetical protein